MRPVPAASDAGFRPVDHYENFPVASWLCPPRLRPPIAAIYWFARTADDIADEGEARASERLADLAAFRADLRAAMDASATSQRWPHVFEPLARAAREFALPEAPLADLLGAFEQDVVKTRDGLGYATREELLDYCRRSANPIGRLLLHLYAVADAKSLERSDCICTALQLINFWQDLGRDIPRGRFYVPAGESLPALVTWARALMMEGAPLVRSIPGRAGWELRLVVQGGLRILDKIEAMDFATLQRRPRVSAWDAPVIAWRALRMTRRM
jgi:phytoene/squalene synthetase